MQIEDLRGSPHLEGLPAALLILGMPINKPLTLFKPFTIWNCLTNTELTFGEGTNFTILMHAPGEICLVKWDCKDDPGPTWVSLKSLATHCKM